MSRRTLLLAAICLAAAIPTLLIPAAPGYDAWTWIIWGREVLDGDLQTVGGISWKPLPVLFTAPLSLFGGAAPELWVVVAVAAAFGAVIAAGMLGFKLGGRLGAVLSAGLVLASPWLWEPVLDGGSEGGVLLCVFAAADRHLADRHGQSFAWGLGAALLRPEAWPFLGLYSVWLLARSRDRWRWVVPGLAALPALWLLPELWGSGDLWRGA